MAKRPITLIILSRLHWKANEIAREKEKTMKSDDFVVRFSGYISKAYTIVCVIMIVIAAVFHFCANMPAVVGIILFLTAALLIFVVYFSTYRCHVTADFIEEKEFGFICKTVPWENIKKTKIKPDKQFNSPTVFLLDDRGKRLFDFSSDMPGYELVLLACETHGVHES